jgi:pyruvate formate lyase activating enzyme
MPKTKMLAKEESNEKIRCLACSHQCLISEGKTGICGVRKNIKGKLSLLVYGRLCAVHVDPIEKKPLYHFMPGTKTFSVGTVGCNFHCTFCQNWAISQASEKGEFFGYNYEPKDVINSALKNNCQSISYTYNEPTIFIEFVKDCATLAKKKGLKNVMVTNGFMSEECFEYIKSEIDAMNIDLKGNDEFYKKICGARLKPVLDTIKRADKARIHVEIKTIIIPV